MSEENLNRLKESIEDWKTLNRLLMLFFVASAITLPLIIIILLIVENYR